VLFGNIWRTANQPNGPNYRCEETQEVIANPQSHLRKVDAPLCRDLKTSLTNVSEILAVIRGASNQPINPGGIWMSVLRHLEKLDNLV
jgi:hypothetical protein